MSQALEALDGRTATPGAGTIQRVGVIGAGVMGSGIAELCARSGLDVVVIEATDAALSAGQERLGASVRRGVQRGKLTRSEGADVLARLRFSTRLADLADREFVVEAVAEDEGLKMQLYADLDRSVSAEDAILASNTSSIPIMKLAMATRRPQQVIGVHFFNPAPVRPLVEIIASLVTGETTLARTEEFVGSTLGRQMIRSTDRPGFVVNALLVPYLLSAIRMLESGFASAEDIDVGMVHGCGHPLGPLALADLIGLDTLRAIAQSMYEELREGVHSPPPLLSRMVEAGLLGRKSGRGFHDYTTTS